jgi:hypothetical protein
MKKLILSALVVLIPFMAAGQQVVAPTATNQNGVPTATVVTICTTNPGAGSCPTKVTIYTDFTVANACTGTNAALNNTANPSVTTGCSNPGSTDAQGNVVAFAAAGSYWCQYSGSTISPYSKPCPVGGGGSGGSVAFGSVTSGTNTTSLVIGNSGSFSATGSGSITATALPFSGFTSGTNTQAAAIIGTGASLVTQPSGQLTGDSSWFPFALADNLPTAPTLTAASSGGTLSTANSVYVRITFVGPSNLVPSPEILINLNSTTGCTTSACTVTVTLPSSCTSPVAPVTGCTVWDSATSNGEKQQAASAACVNITTSTCVIGTIAAGSLLSSVVAATSGINPPSMVATTPPDFIIPSAFMQKANGYYALAGIDTSGLNLISCCYTAQAVTPPTKGGTNNGTFTFLDRVFFNDDINPPPISNALISIKHESGATTSTLTSAGAGVDDRAIAVRIDNDLTSNPNYEQYLGIYVENFVDNNATTCAPIGNQTAVGESCSAAVRGITTDKRVTGANAMTLEGVTGVASTTTATPNLPGGAFSVVGVKGGAFESASSTNGANANFVGVVGGINAASGNTAGTGISLLATAPTTRFATQNIGLRVADFGANAADWDVLTISSNVAAGNGASYFEGNVYLPEIVGSNSTIPILESINVTGGIATTQLSAPTISATAPANPGATVCDWKATAVDVNGNESAASAQNGGGTCNANLTATNFVTITIASQRSATSYNIYRTVEAGNCNGVACTNGKIGSVTVPTMLTTQNSAVTFTDTGQVGDGNTSVAQPNQTGGIKPFNYQTNTNCVSSASPAVCGSAASGGVALPTGVNPTLQVNTTAVTATSRIFLNVDESLTGLGTCNTTLSTLLNPVVTARVANASFTFTINATLAVNAACVSYFIVN